MSHSSCTPPLRNLTGAPAPLGSQASGVEQFSKRQGQVHFCSSLWRQWPGGLIADLMRLCILVMSTWLKPLRTGTSGQGLHPHGGRGVVGSQDQAGKPIGLGSNSTQFLDGAQQPWASTSTAGGPPSSKKGRRQASRPGLPRSHTSTSIVLRLDP